MNYSHLNTLRGAGCGSRDHRARWARRHAAARARAAGLGHSVHVRPGRGCPCFPVRSLLAFVEQATLRAVNDYEGRMLGAYRRKLEECVTTQGTRAYPGCGGIDHLHQRATIEIPCVRAAEVVTPPVRRCLSRRSLYGLAAASTGRRRQTRVADGLDQDRVAWRPESFHAPTNQAPVPQEFRLRY